MGFLIGSLLLTFFVGVPALVIYRFVQIGRSVTRLGTALDQSATRHAERTVNDSISPQTSRQQPYDTPKWVAPAGWFPDPAGGASKRYWDGRVWTNQFSDNPPAGRTPPPSAYTQAYQQRQNADLILVGGIILAAAAILAIFGVHLLGTLMVCVFLVVISLTFRLLRDSIFNALAARSRPNGGQAPPASTDTTMDPPKTN